MVIFERGSIIYNKRAKQVNEIIWHGDIHFTDRHDENEKQNRKYKQ